MPGQRHAHHGVGLYNDDESGLHHDSEIWLEKLAPHAPSSAYRLGKNYWQLTDITV